MSNEIITRKTTANAASLVVSSNPCIFRGMSGYSANAAEQYIQIHDAASLPANGSVPAITFDADPTSDFGIEIFSGAKFATGIVVCNSSTQATLTLGSADCWFNVQVEPIK